MDDDAARQMVDSVNKVQESVSLLDDNDQRAEWLETLRVLAERDGVYGLLRGRCCRLLLEQNVLDEAALQHLTGLALSPVTPAPDAAAWIEGVLGGSGLLMLHQDGLWRALDRWLQNCLKMSLIHCFPSCAGLSPTFTLLNAEKWAIK